MVHGDDFVGVGRPAELSRIRAALEDKYKLKVEVLSGDKSDVQEVKILNKIVRWTNKGVELEADPRHAEIVVRELGLRDATPSKVPGVKIDVDSVRKPLAEVKVKAKAAVNNEVIEIRKKHSATIFGKARGQARRENGQMRSRPRGR